MTPRQQRFIAEYLVDGVGKKAAIRAGYAPQRAEITACELLRRDDVRAAIAKGQGRIADKLEVSAERVVAEMARIAFADIADVLSWDGQTLRVRSFDALTVEQRAAIAAIEQDKDGGLKVKFHSKQAALDSLSKHLGLFAPEKHEHHVAGLTDDQLRAVIFGGLAKIGATPPR